MRRREFIALLGGTTAAWPLGARGQQSTEPVIGFMSPRSREEAAAHTAAFLQGLEETGYVAGRNVVVEYRWAEGHYDRLAAFAADLVRRRVAVIAALGGIPSAQSAAAATSTIPVVFLIGDDPVRLGLVRSLNRPGGNVTGVTLATTELGGKRLELLHGLVPGRKVAALLANPTSSNAEAHAEDVRKAADALGLQLLVLRASSEAELGEVFGALPADGIGMLVVQNDPFFDSQRGRLVALSARHDVPAIYHIREYPQIGGLMSYGPSLLDAYRRVGVHTGRVLKGASPSEFPVTEPTRFELVINMKTAETLRLTIPPALLDRADEVIE